MALTAKQARFVAEYLKDLNAAQAAIRAGYSSKTAESQGPRLLSFVEVRKAVDEALERRNERVEVKADDILRELLRLALVDIGEAFDTEGKLKPLHEMSVDVRRAISGIEVEESSIRLTKIDEDGNETREPVARIKKVKFWDKTKGLELLGKHLKLFTDRVEHSGALTLEQLVVESLKPPEGGA